MFEIVIFKDARGIQPIQDLIDALQAQADTNKAARVRLNKIRDNIKALAQRGTYLGMPQTRHIERNVWELRPMSDRIFYFCNAGREIVLLHHFHKKTRTTPRREIEQAIRNMHSYLAGEKT